MSLHRALAGDGVNAAPIRWPITNPRAASSRPGRFAIGVP